MIALLHESISSECIVTMAGHSLDPKDVSSQARPSVKREAQPAFRTSASVTPSRELSVMKDRASIVAREAHNTHESIEIIQAT